MKKPEARDYYELLNIPRSATKEEIKNAYRELALVFHPDSQFFTEVIAAPASPGSMDLFKRITAAYNVLMNPESRKQYDAGLPPVMRGWEEGEAAGQDELAEKFMRRRLTKEENVEGFGSFGKVQPAAFDEAQAEVPAEEQSGESGSGVWDQLRSIFGRVKV